jgi:hypothetical protein
LLYPTFYPFDPDLFQWLLQDLGSEFMTSSRLMNLIAGRASMRRMARVPAADERLSVKAGCQSVIAITRANSASGLAAA